MRCAAALFETARAAANSGRLLHRSVQKEVYIARGLVTGPFISAATKKYCNA